MSERYYKDAGRERIRNYESVPPDIDDRHLLDGKCADWFVKAMLKVALDEINAIKNHLR